MTTMSPRERNVIQAVYRIEGDVLRVCMSKGDGLPKDYSAKRGSNCILVTLKKILDR